MRWLLTDGGARSGVEMKDKYGRTPLASAASAEQLAVVRLLAEQGADVDTENKQGATPLLVAVKDDKPKVVELLLSLGAEEDVENAMALAKHEHDLHHLMKVRQSFPYPGKLTVSWKPLVPSSHVRNECGKANPHARLSLVPLPQSAP